MNINDIVSTLVERINLTEDLEKIDTEIVGWLNGGARSLSSHFLNSELITQLTTITQNNNQPVALSKSEVLANLNKLRLALKNLPLVEVAVPFVTDREFEKQISNLIKKDYKEPFRLKFSTKTELIAGAQIGFKGKFKDYSFLKKLTDSQDDLFREVLQNYD